MNPYFEIEDLIFQKNFLSNLNIVLIVGNYKVEVDDNRVVNVLMYKSSRLWRNKKWYIS